MDPKVKLALVGGVAVVAVGVAALMATRSLGVGRTVRSASQAATAEQHDRVVPAPGGPSMPGGAWEEADGGRREFQAAGPPPKWMEQELALDAVYAEPLEFPKADDAARSFGLGAEDLALRAESDAALGTLGYAARRGLIDTWRAFLQPLVEGDKAAFEAAVAGMGGVSDKGESGSSPAGAIYDRIGDYLAGARVNLASARLLDKDASMPGAVPMAAPQIKGGPSGVIAIPMMVDVRETADEAGNTTTVRNLSVPLSSLFPEAAALAQSGAKTVQVWAPAKLKSGKGDRADIGPSAFFVHNPKTGAWQPIAMRIALVSEQAAEKLNAVMKSRRNAVSD